MRIFWKCLVVLAMVLKESTSYIETVEDTGCESCLLLLTCRHLDSIIAVLEATFEPLENSTTLQRPTAFPPSHPRLALNKRCSGANHCSFILNKDCPGADKWGRGNITVKYVCISERRVNTYCNQNITVGTKDEGTDMAEGFVHNPGYPRFYLGHHDNCRWKITAHPAQKIRITILDLSVIEPPHKEDSCRDTVEVRESDRVLYTSCTQEQPPMEIVSERNEMEVSFSTKEPIVPTRGVFFHYTAVGCLMPKLPKNSHIEYKTEDNLVLTCDAGYVFEDITKRKRVITCNGYKWDVSLPWPRCENLTSLIEEDVYKIHITKQVIINREMNDITQAIVIPAIIIVLLFLINAIVVFYIYKRRVAVMQTNTDEEMQVVNTSRA